MSTHRIPVIAIEKLPHPNADALSLVKVGGYTVVVKTSDWEEGQLAAYVPPDYEVPLDRPEFSWLSAIPDGKRNPGYHRVSVKRFRGVYSQGLLAPATEGSNLGDNLLEVLGVRRYEPPADIMAGAEATDPPDMSLVIPTYDIESWEEYSHLFGKVQAVVITEKLHGTSSRFVWDGERFHAGSRNLWKLDTQSTGNVWWRMLRDNPELQEFLKAHPRQIVYGETFGAVQSLKYGATNDKPFFFRAFDIWTGAAWMEFEELCSVVPEHMRVPLLMPVMRRDHLKLDENLWLLDLDTVVRGLADGQSTLADHIREGCVVRAIPETITMEIGRLQLKKVSDKYLEKA